MRVFIALIIWLLGFYPYSGKVIEYDNGISIIETSDGNLWEWFDELHEGQNVTMLMHNNGTSFIEDDFIVQIGVNP